MIIFLNTYGFILILSNFATDNKINVFVSSFRALFFILFFRSQGVILGCFV